MTSRFRQILFLFEEVFPGVRFEHPDQKVWMSLRKEATPPMPKKGVHHAPAKPAPQKEVPKPMRTQLTWEFLDDPS